MKFYLLRLSFLLAKQQVDFLNRNLLNCLSGHL